MGEGSARRAPEEVIYLDTHALVWMVTGQYDLLGPRTLGYLANEDVRISPAVLLELSFLQERGRVLSASARYAHELQQLIGGSVCPMPFLEIVAASMSETWTRDPFDRLIVGHAKAAGAPLLTKDRSIRKHYRRAIW